MRLLLATLFGCLLLGASAEAGTVRLQEECPNCGGGGGLVLLWKGDPGEANRITVEAVPGGGAMLVRETGAGATLTSASAHCTVEARVARCEQPMTFYVFLYGEDGNDELSTAALSGSFSDSLYGGPGDDTLDTGDHTCCIGARLIGGPGDDTMHGGTGIYDEAVYEERTASVDVSLAARPPGARNGEVGERDVLAADMDGLFGGRGDDVLTGDDGDNYIWTGEGTDLVRMGDGRDVQWGDSWYDQGLDEIHGEGGPDHFYPGPKPGLIVGGPGIDHVYLDNFGPPWFSRLSLDGQANDGGIVRSDVPGDEHNVPAGNLLEVEGLSGNDAADVLIGDAGPNGLSGEGGPDVIKGAAGADRIFADGYDDEGGDDFVHALDGEPDAVSCGGGIDVVLADPVDELAADCEQVSADDLPLPDLKLPDLELPEVPVPPVTVEYVPPAPVISPPPVLPPPPVFGEAPLPVSTPPAIEPTCRDVHVTIEGTGTSAGDCLVGSARGDRISGAAGADRLTGNRGDDRLRGGPGDDMLHGGAGEDRLHGEAGNDMLTGGSGRDRLAGGRGSDFLVAADGRTDAVICGPGRDAAVVDRQDRVSGCEKVARARRPARSRR